eukprot:GILK01001024.1.p1 GENE.GILK01001024.1~~GILK01001024.1.p1  ORF type:complete len:302 (+),score=33.80 GILK01001024.1:50-955(+)
MSRQVPIVCPGHTKSIVQLHYSPITPDGFFLISACKDNKPMLRNGESGDWIGTFEGHKGAVWSAHLNTEATKAVTGSADFTARIFDALSGDQLHQFEHGHVVKTVQFSKDGKKVLTGGQEKILRIFDLENPSAEPATLTGHSDAIKTAVWGVDDSVIISGSGESKLRIWDPRTMTAVREVATRGPIMDIELSRDNNLITVAAGQDVYFINSRTFEIEKTHSLNLDLESASVHPNGTIFVTGESKNNWVRVFEKETGRELECHKGHHGPVHSVRFAPNGDTFSSGSDDGTIRIWQTTALTQE